MADTPKQDETEALVHWTYSRGEWKTFMRWKKMKKGVFHYIFHRLFPKRNPKTPGIMITREKISIDDADEAFRGDDRQLKGINIRDAGRINVMEISYERSQGSDIISEEIYIPVPRGKLREAIEVQEKLNTGKGLI